MRVEALIVAEEPLNFSKTLRQTMATLDFGKWPKALMTYIELLIDAKLALLRGLRDASVCPATEPHAPPLAAWHPGARSSE